MRRLMVITLSAGSRPGSHARLSGGVLTRYARSAAPGAAPR